MKQTASLTKKVVFNVRWRFMTQEKKYAYLWSKTLKSLPQSDLDHAENANGMVGG